MRIFNYVCIFSVDRIEDTKKLNNQKQAMTRRILNKLSKIHGITWNEAKGMYKGESETSFVVVMDNRDKFKPVMNDIYDIATRTKQESILVQDAQGESYLCYLTDGRKEKLGKLRQVESIQGLDAYTELNGKYYAIVS